MIMGVLRTRWIRRGHGHVDGYLEYNLGMMKMQDEHQLQMRMGMCMGVGVGVRVSSGGYYDGWGIRLSSA